MSKALDASDYRDTRFYLYEVLETKGETNSTFTGFETKSWDKRASRIDIYENKTHSHTGWVRDLEVGGERQYGGSGDANFRPGHVLGCVAWRGRWVAEYNLTNNSFLRIKGFPSENHLLSALFQAVLFVLFGWFIIPFTLIFLLIGSDKRGALQYCVNTNSFNPFPGMLSPETRCFFMDILTLGVMLYYWGQAALAYSGSMFLWVAFFGFVVATITHFRTLRSISRAYESFITYSREQILERYAKVKEKGAAKATSAA